ncbi:diguanylate cyclase domain-containing protein [Thaumasiovibrio sp. DFM-14]|uniref:sensor domain-containing diguanylate cyclase n=1 Tax=Thaumasiovibrio sp. DFM-14 TaxID=3384792 RepID=UPI0039A0C3B4
MIRRIVHLVSSLSILLSMMALAQYLLQYSDGAVRLLLEQQHYLTLTSAALLLSMVCYFLSKPSTKTPDFKNIYPYLTGLPTAALVVRNKDGQLLYANKMCREQLHIRRVGLHYFYPSFLDASSIHQLLRPHDFERGFQFAKETLHFGEHLPLHVMLTGRVIVMNGVKARLVFLTETAAEEGSRKQENTVFQSVLNSLNEMVHYTDNDGHVLGTNKSFDRFWQGRIDEGIMLGDVRSEIGSRSTTSWTTAPDGTSRLLETSQTSLIDSDGEVFGSLSISHDVTDWHDMQESLKQEIEKRELTEQTLAQRTNLLDTLFAASQDPIGLYNEHGMYVGCNEAFIRWVANGKRDLRGLRVIDVLGEEAWEAQRSIDLDVMENGCTLKTEEYAILEDDTPLWYEVMRSPYNDPSTDSKGVLIMARDVTERKMAEQQLADAIMDLQELSFIDSLTKVANRRSFDEQLTRLWHTHVREEHPLSLILCDIDYFKAFNDNYGHQQGDEALRKVANVFKSVIRRETDVVARYGGEEFAFLLPNTDNEGALVVSAAIHEALATKPLSHEYSQVSSRLTVSLGIATMFPQRNSDYGELVALADRALYRAKGAGRNCTHNLISEELELE